jgi:molecular chaperone DnaK (HSP70)
MMGDQSSNSVIRELLPSWPFKSCAAKFPSGKIHIRLDQVYTPSELPAQFRTYRKEVAQKSLGQQELRDIVVTDLANCHNHPRTYTIEAAKTAGQNVLRLLHEPTAAATQFAWHNNGKGDAARLVVLDIDGGILEVSLIDKKGGQITVQGVEEDPRLGGRDLNSIQWRRFLLCERASEGRLRRGYADGMPKGEGGLVWRFDCRSGTLAFHE